MKTKNNKNRVRSQEKITKFQGPNEIELKFADKQLTNYGGLKTFADLLRKLGVGKLVSRKLKVKRGDNKRYSVYDFVTMILAGILAGAEHMNQVALISKDVVLKELFNWTDSPDESTFCRFTNLLGWEHQNQLVSIMDNFRRKVWNVRWLGQVILDLDSTVKTKYGNQEGARKGFNPHKRGAKSVHPLLCFINRTKEILNAWYRPGDVYTSHGVIDFTKECLAKLPKRVWKKIVRADSGFFNGEYFDFLEQNKIAYVVKVKLKNLRTILSREDLRWRKARNSDIYQTTSFEYKCNKWSKARRFVAIRKIKSIDDDGNLFPIEEYEYACYVTNIGQWSPMRVHKFYKERGTSENWIDEIKNQCAAGQFTKQSFWSSAFIFQLSILAYNLKIWLTWLTDEEAWREEFKTFRFWFIKMAAKLVRPQGRKTLKAQDGYFFQNRWLKIDRALANLNFY